MAIVKDLIDEWSELASGRSRWETYWRNVAAWVLPQTEEFDRLVSTGTGSQAIMAVTGTPVASERSKFIYDMTSLWGIDRLTAGLISLKTPESDYWHDLNIDSDYGYEPTHEEEVALERIRNYQFRVRANPMSGFWPTHKHTVKSMCAFGDGWHFIKELDGKRVPWLYVAMHLHECFPGVGPDGHPNRMFRVFNWSTHQVATEFKEAAGAKVLALADDPKRRHDRVRVMHAVRPRSDEQRNKLGLRGAEFASWYCLPDENHLIGEGGFWEFPFSRYAWSNIGQRPYCEGPIAYAIAEIQSLNEMARNELIAQQMVTRPPLATHGKNFGRLNFNPGATNPGLINGDGRPLFAPLSVGVRPDFAQQVIEARRNSVREALYLNLWQILVQLADGRPETATEAMLRAQEKGEMLGPVGISLNDGLSQNTDREIGILNRKGAFKAGSPLAIPASLDQVEVAPQFTSPLDRLRKVGQVIGAQRVIELGVLLAQAGHTEALARLDADELMELAQQVHGAPISILQGRDVSKQAREQAAQTQQAATAIQGTQAAGEAAQAVGTGAQAVAAGTEAAKQSPTTAAAVQQMLQQYAQQQRPAVPARVAA